MKLNALLLAGFAALATGGLSAAAGAQTYTFDEFAGTNYSAVPDGYAGLNWRNIYLVDNADKNAFPTGTISSPEVAYNSYGNPGSFYVPTFKPFTFNSAYFGGQTDGYTFEVDGYFGEAQVYSTMVTVNASTPTFVKFNWQGVTSVSFNTTDHNYFSLDNMTINGAVPEPATWAMMVLGFGMVGFGLRSRRRSAVASIA